MFYYGVILEDTMIAAQMEAGRNKRTSNKEASGAAGAAREPELTAIRRGLVRTREHVHVVADY